MTVDPFKNRLEKWKRALIDLTKRNRLLNYQPSRITTIQIIDELPADVFRILQLEGKSMKFLPTTSSSAEIVPIEINQQTHFEPPLEIPIKSKDKFLQTKLSTDKLNESLLRIFRKASSLFEEQGLSTLFISLGMLEWYESDESDVPLKAPLLLLPVELTRKVAWQDFTLKTTEDDPVINPAITEQLRLAFGLVLPDLPENMDEFSPDEYFNNVREIIAKQSRWKLINDTYLDFFSFQKFLMYKDMERYEESYYESRLIQALCNTKNDRTRTLPESIEKADLDLTLLPESTFHVLDADSSQQRAVLAVKEKHDLVIEGPPGTGKSQTITNIIADALADGKTILFVSEKMAALDVVYKRLQTLGLHDFCLQLHSHRTNKRMVYDEIIRVLDNVRPRDHAKDADLTQLGGLRVLLNQYASELHTSFGKLAEKPFDVLGQLSLVLRTAPLIKAELPNIHDVDQLTLRNTFSDVRDLMETLLDLGKPNKHPWHGSELRNVNNSELASIQEALGKTIEGYARLFEQANMCADYVGIVHPNTIEEANILCEAAITIGNSPGVSQAILDSAQWNEIPVEASDLLRHGHNFARLREQVLSSFKADVLDLELADVGSRFKQYSNPWTRFMKLDYWRDRQFLLNYLRTERKHLSTDEISKELKAVLDYQFEKAYLLSHSETGQALFEQRWLGLDSNWNELQKFADWVVRMRQFIVAGILQSKAIAFATNGKLDFKETRKMVEALQQVLGYLVASIHELIQLSKFSEKSAQVLNANSKLDIANNWLKTLLANIEKLHQLTVYNDRLAVCLAGIAGPMTKRFIENGYDPSLLETTFKRFFYERWLDLVFANRKQLAAFTSLIHEQKIQDFRGLDIKSISLARQRLLHHLYQKREVELAKPGLGAELTTLQRELRKKARHLPLRKLFTKTPNIISSIKPCFMMSPLSAALFLDPTIYNFDLVIFDEASQVPTEDAVGSLVRGKQAVVVGDPKQLPPTNFFHMQLQTDEYPTDDDDIIDEVDSVLDEFVSIGFPKKPLLWHYRSQHESLIEFSNRHFYKNLLTFPAPHMGTENLGLQFTFVGGIYKGQGVNPVEAKAVADAVCAHIRQQPELSLGVGTFNMNQQALILDELEQRRREDPSLEFFFSKKGEDQFFVKNLENIQGDERDVIFISVTYGPDEAGRIKYNFGPVNGDNGWRRLNVIFTRAKRCLRVFSSMHGEEIDPTKIHSQGAQLLRDFLIFAEKRQWKLPEYGSAVSIETPFERSVYEALSVRGLKLVPQVGQSGYRIDFGVLDDAIPGQFIAGIECDGTTYYEALTARDRDRLRQKVLEDLGWNIIRVWSVDWWRDKDTQIDKILRSVSEAKAKYQTEKNIEESIVIEPSVEDIEIEKFSLETLIEPARAFSDIQAQQATHAEASNGEALRVPPYKLTLLSPYGTADDFHTAPNEQVSETLERIVTREAPIHLNELIKRVASCWTITRITKPVKDKIKNVLSELNNNARLIVKDEYVWTREEQNTIVRNRHGLGYSFDPEQICYEEYEQAVCLALEAYGTRMKENLIQDVAKLLGFSRTNQKITTRLIDIIQNLISTGKIMNAATGLTIVKNAPQSDMVFVDQVETIIDAQ